MSESLEDIAKEIPNGIDNTTDFVNITGGVMSNINYKLAIYMFVFGLFLFSDVFVDGFLSYVPNTIDGEYTTNKGTTVQLLLFVLLLVIFDLLIQYEFV